MKPRSKIVAGATFRPDDFSLREAELLVKWAKRVLAWRKTQEVSKVDENPDQRG